MQTLNTLQQNLYNLQLKHSGKLDIIDRLIICELNALAFHKETPNTISMLIDDLKDDPEYHGYTLPRLYNFLDRFPFLQYNKLHY